MNELEKSWDDYTSKVYAYAEKMFNNKVLPYLKKYHLSFSSGMGAWSIQSTKNTPQSYINSHPGYYVGSIDSESLPIWLLNILDAEIEGMPAQSLGTIMPNYDGE